MMLKTILMLIFTSGCVLPISSQETLEKLGGKESVAVSFSQLSSLQHVIGQNSFTSSDRFWFLSVRKHHLIDAAKLNFIYGASIGVLRNKSSFVFEDPIYSNFWQYRFPGTVNENFKDDYILRSSVVPKPAIDIGIGKELSHRSFSFSLNVIFQLFYLNDLGTEYSYAYFIADNKPVSSSNTAEALVFSTQKSLAVPLYSLLSLDWKIIKYLSRGAFFGIVGTSIFPSNYATTKYTFYPDTPYEAKGGVRHSQVYFNVGIGMQFYQKDQMLKNALIKKQKKMIFN